MRKRFTNIVSIILVVLSLLVGCSGEKASTNPEKNNEQEAKDYKWSNYNEYIKKNSFTDTEFFLSMLDSNIRKAKKYFIEELKKENEGIVYLTADNVRRTDTEANEIIRKDLKEFGKEVGEMTREQRIFFIKNVKAKGITNNQYNTEQETDFINEKLPLYICELRKEVLGKK